MTLFSSWPVSSRIGTVLAMLVIAAPAFGAARYSEDSLSSSASLNASARTSLPDLEIESAMATLGDKCEPHSPLLYITAELRNRGNGPVFVDEWRGTIYAMAQHTRGWGNGLKFPAMGKGETESVTFPIYYLRSSPAEMAGTHEFLVGVVIDSIEDADDSNNYFGPISVTVPESFCTPE